jgi:hypothetical protein
MQPVERSRFKEKKVFDRKRGASNQLFSVNGKFSAAPGG